MVLNPKLAVGVALILWVPCLLKKGSFYIIGKQTSGFPCSQLYARNVYDAIEKYDNGKFEMGQTLRQVENGLQTNKKSFLEMLGFAGI